MSRLTGTDAYGLMEAYQAVYAPQELTEEQVWEEVENWVNSLLEEGYDLSDYTWEEMYEEYLNEAGNPGGALAQQQRLQQSAQNYARTSSGGTLGAGGGQAAMRALQAKGVDPRSAYARVYTQGQKNIEQAGRQPAQSTGMYGRYAPPSMQQRTPAPTPPVRTNTPPVRTNTPPVRTATPPGGTTKPTAPATTTPSPSAPRPKDTSITDMIGRSQVRQGAAVNTGNTSSDTRAIAGRSSVGATPKPATSTATARPTPRQARLNMEMEYDTFDTVLEYLVSEGYADTEESALVIMANMSEEWKQSIVEGVGGYDDPVMGPHTLIGKSVRSGLTTAKNIATKVVNKTVPPNIRSAVAKKAEEITSGRYGPPGSNY